MIIDPKRDQLDFPSFSEGLSLRLDMLREKTSAWRFPFLFGGTFIEAKLGGCHSWSLRIFPFLFGGTFIEAADDGTARQSQRFPFLFGGTFIEA